jgi:heme-degrading monooxygenase HmoA
MKIITILKAEITDANWDVLRNAYRNLGSSGKKIPGLLGSNLLQSKDNPQIWQIITTWESLEALEEMRATTDTPGGVLVFREAGGEPSLSIFEVREEINR